jgi:hypothetical protein
MQRMALDYPIKGFAPTRLRNSCEGSSTRLTCVTPASHPGLPLPDPERRRDQFEVNIRLPAAISSAHFGFWQE